MIKIHPERHRRKRYQESLRSPATNTGQKRKHVKKEAKHAQAKKNDKGCFIYVNRESLYIETRTLGFVARSARAGPEI